jgi:hypothetical protein
MEPERVEITAGEIASQLGTKNDMAVRTALTILEKAGHVAAGREPGTAALVAMTASLDDALAVLSGESIEAELLRDLILVRNVNDRAPTEVDIADVGAGLAASEAQVMRAMNQLAARGIMSYRNVYSGRGVGLLDPEPVTELRIDRRELASRAAAEQGKLRKMIDYCYHQGCLRRFILGYFGDRKQPGRCGSCSSCAPRAHQPSTGDTGKNKQAGTLTVRTAGSSPGGQQDGLPEEWQPVTSGPLLRHRTAADTKPAPPPDNDVTAVRNITESERVTVKKILSCVARLNDRFGKGTIAAVLRGSQSKQVAQHELKRLSTYGLLSDMPHDEIIGYIKALIQAGCIATNRGGYPTLRLTEQGREVMFGRADVRLALAD